MELELDVFLTKN